VVGEAAQPQAIPYRANMTLLDVMIAVGGLTDFAAGNRATLVRTTEGGQREYSLRISDLLKDGDPKANVSIMPGDVIIIPESFF
jgi:polysaccharide export outer membrane protein